MAAPGVEVTVAGGFTGRVASVDGNVARVLVPDDDRPPIELEVELGEPVRVGGEATSLVRAQRPAPGRGTLLPDDSAPAMDDELFEALRSWRARIAAAAGVPAYLVFHDRHLQVIAGRKPRTVRELATCPGVGPTKLERYADDVLDLVEAHTS